MDTLKFETGGFPMSIDRLASMQQCWKDIYEMLRDSLYGGLEPNYVIEGCGAIKQQDGRWCYDGTSDGVIVVKGEILPFKKGTGTYVVIKETTAEEIGYEDGNNKPFRISRYATLALQPDRNNLTIYDFDAVNNRRTFVNLWNATARQTELDKALNRISQLETRLAAVNTAISGLSASTDANLDALGANLNANLSDLQRQLVPKGTIVMTAQPLPLEAKSTEELISGMGVFYGYIPCSICTIHRSTINYWNGYFDRLGLPVEARFSTPRPELSYIQANMPLIAQKCRVTCPDMTGRFPCCVSQNTEDRQGTLLKTEDEDKMAYVLSVTQQIKHVHLNFLIKVI